MPTKKGENCLAGCVAVAVAQLMSCWEYPDKYDGVDFDWFEMKWFPTAAESTLPAHMISRLLLILGKSDMLDMDYGLSGSGAYCKKIPKVMKKLGYSSHGGRKHYDVDRVNAELKDGYPLIASGSSKKVNVLGIKVYPEGHAWLIEELLERKRTKYTYTNGTLTKTETLTSHLVYCNWGWSGRDNGYYYHKVFNTDEETGGPADITRAVDGNYKYELRTYTGIRK